MNELSIQSVEEICYNEVTYDSLKYDFNIPKGYIWHTKDFVLKDKIVMVVNCDSDFFLHPCIRSLFKNTNKDDFTLIVFDNSYVNKANIKLYHHYRF